MPRHEKALSLTALAALYFAQGLPYGFFHHALPLMMRERGASLKAIGLSTLLALPWALKFLWAPFIDAYGSERLGKRKSWIVPLQLAAVALLAYAGLCIPPTGALSSLLAVAAVANLLAATQDIATDGFAVNTLQAAERGFGNSIQVGGYRLGMIVGGGLIVMWIGTLGWTGAFLLIATLLAVSTIPSLFVKEVPRETGAFERRGPSDARAQLRSAVAFFSRPGAMKWLLVLATYKSGDAFATAMLRPFLFDRKISPAQIGAVVGTAGSIAALLGALAGGLIVRRWGVRRTLIGAAMMQAATVLGCAWLSSQSAIDLAWLYAGSIVEHVASAIGTVALFTAMMGWSRHGNAGSDYTVQSCVLVMATGLAGVASGAHADRFGYTGHFTVAAIACAAAVLPLLLVEPLIEAPRDDA